MPRIKLTRMNRVALLFLRFYLLFLFALILVKFIKTVW